jgi:hypothetical protein
MVSVALSTEVLVTSDAPWGIVGIEMSGAGVPGGTAPSGAASTPGSLGAMHLKLLRPYQPDSSDSTTPPNNWRRVESEALPTCS